MFASSIAVHIGALLVFVWLVYEQLLLRRRLGILRDHLLSHRAKKVVVDYPLCYVKRLAEGLGISFRGEDHLTAWGPRRIRSHSLFQLLTHVTVDSIEYVVENKKGAPFRVSLKLNMWEKETSNEEYLNRQRQKVEEDLKIKVSIHKQSAREKA